MLVWLVPLIRLVKVDLGDSFSLFTLLSGLSNFISEYGHFFYLDVALGLFVQLIHVTKGFFAQTVRELVGP